MLKQASNAICTDPTRYFPVRNISPDFESNLFKLAHKLNIQPDEKAKTIMFTSAVHGEGVSFVTLNLARTIASLGKHRVLLMDVNFRRSAFSQLPKSYSLKDYLQESNCKEHFDDLIIKTDIKALDFIHSGTVEGSKQIPLNNPEFESLLERLSDNYNIILMDSPPVNLYLDSSYLAPLVGGVVLVIHADETRREVILYAKKSLEEVNANILGAVLNGRKYHIPAFLYDRLL